MNPPEGYFLIEDKEYILKDGDLYMRRHWSDEAGFRSVRAYGTEAHGLTIGQIENKAIYRSMKWGLVIATKNKPKPRFNCDKPYPYGY